MINSSFNAARPILSILENRGFQAYFVGGAVRDALIGKETGDIDITTSARPEDVIRLFKKVIPVGIEHGTVIVRWEGESYEVTTFRTEAGYTDFRHPDEVTFVANVEEDLQRRDFTINAIAMDKNNKIIDPFGGKADLEKKIIRAVGEPEERFKEDPLRIMRAVRFISQLGFKLESRTYEGISTCSPLLQKIAIERITVEIEKLFAGRSVKEALKIIETTGMEYAIPVWKQEAEVFKKILPTVSPLYSMEEVLCLFILSGAETTISDWVKEWKLSNKVKNNAAGLLAAYDAFQKEGCSNWLVYKLPEQLAGGLRRLISIFHSIQITKEEWDERYISLPIKKRQELDFNGKDIIAIFPDQPRGEWIKDILNKAEYAVVSGALPNDNNAIKEWVRNGEHPQAID